MDWGNLKADYERLGSYAAVAAEYGVSVSCVGQHARSQGVNRGWSNASSPLESMLQAALRKVGLSFTAQAFVGGRYWADVLLHQAPVIIEADGNWHKVRKEHDAERDANLAAEGYRVFRFDGAQLNRDALGCITEVMSACGLVPDSEPQVVLRTSHMGSENPHWSGGPVMVTCERCGAETARNAYRTQMKKRFCNSKCYGAWLTDHPEAGNRRLRIDWSDLPALYQGGMSIADLAAKYDCGKNTILRQLRRMDVPKKRMPKVPTVSKFSDEHRAKLRSGWEKRRATGKAPGHDAAGRFASPTA